MSQKTYSGSLALTKLKHVKMNGKGKGGKVVEGLFIPIEANKLVLGKPQEDGSVAVYLPIRIIAKEETDNNGQNGFVAKSISSEDYKAAKTDEEKKAIQEFTPILGSIKDFSASAGEAAATEGAVSTNTFDPDDDLPF